MIIKVEQDLTKKEIEVLIKHNDRNHEVERIVALIQLAEKQIQCNLQGKEMLVNVSDIYYIESVDKKTFVYCEKEVYRTELRLYQLLEILSKSSFIQVSKSCILNLNMLESLLLTILTSLSFFFVKFSVDGNMETLNSLPTLTENQELYKVALNSNTELANMFLFSLTCLVAFVFVMFFYRFFRENRIQIGCLKSLGYKE